MTDLLSLSKLDRLMDYIPAGAKIHYKSGVWNPYNEITREQLGKGHEFGNGYGYDLMEENGEYYVSNPCSSDMW